MKTLGKRENLNNNPIFLYLANPTHGGWISFTAHLLRQFQEGTIVFKIGKKLENKLRPFGWGTWYQNIPEESLTNLSTIDYHKQIVVTALEKSHYHLFPLLENILKENKKLTIITHDTVEFKKEAFEWIRDNQDLINLIAIRENIRKYLKEYKDITKCKVILHPFYEWLNGKSNNVIAVGDKTKHPVSISRVDYDKHTEFLIEANKLLPEEENKILIYGKVNRMYAYQKLNDFLEPEQIPFHKKYPYYVKPLSLDFDELTAILNGAKASIDMSAIQHDGGGTQYTFLESIYMGVPLILNRKWETKNNNSFLDGQNCFYVDGAKELRNILQYLEKNDREHLANNAKSILKQNVKANRVWVGELSN